MSCLRILLLMLLASASASVIGSNTRIRDHVRIPRFTTSRVNNNSLTMPSTETLPPFLRSLSITFLSPTKLIAVSAIIPTHARGILRGRRHRVFIIRFRAPRIRLVLHARGSRAKGFSLRGTATHIFRRPFGMRLERSLLSVPAATAALTARLAANPVGPRLVAIVDHASAAQRIGLTLLDSAVIVFGNPTIGSELWRLNSAVGIELPTEVMLAASPLGQVYVGWNAASLLRSRFNLARRDGVLERMDALLASLASVAAGVESRQGFVAAGLRFDKHRMGRGLEGVRIARQKGDADAAFSGLIEALEAVPTVNIAFQVAHDLAAEAAGVPTDGKLVRVVVFGNPALGTAVMQRAFTAALDLPVKMGVWTDSDAEDGGKFNVGYTAPEWIGRRHNVDVPERLSSALSSLADVALQAGFKPR